MKKLLLIAVIFMLAVSPIAKAAIKAPGLKTKTWYAALNAYAWAKSHHKLGANKNIMTIVDFTLPSYKKRLWVINVKQHRVLLRLHVEHATQSGWIIPTHFSNAPRSHESSLGVYVTSNTYYGHYGYAMRLNGLEKNINNNARRRNIVVHGAKTATSQILKQYGRIGRSYGCFAVNPKESKKLISLTRGGSAWFAYGKSENRDPIAMGAV